MGLVIEEKLTESYLVLVFVSATAINSKYVRREIKYADAIDKPVLSIQLEQTKLSHGLGMLLTQYQMLDVGENDFQQRALSAVTYSG